MVRVSFLRHDGVEQIVEAAEGCSLMQAGINEEVPGIVAQCGGGCACGTCQVYVSEAWIEKVGTSSSMEADILEFSGKIGPGSRLSCQIKLTHELDGIVVSVPEFQ